MHDRALTKDLQAVMFRYAEVARPSLIDAYGVKSCVESTRVTVECLKRFGVRAEAMPVSLRVKSPESGWVCGLSEEEIKLLPPSMVNLCPPDQAWRGHHVAMADGNGYRHLIDASFDQVRLEDVVIQPMVLVLEADAAPPNARLGSLQASLDYEVSLMSKESSSPNVLKLSYRESADRSFVNVSVREIALLQPTITLICERMMSS